MFFQISPTVKKTRPTVQKSEDNEENNLEVLSLAPFTQNPKIAFDNVQIGHTHVRKLVIQNPTTHSVELFIENSIPEELGVKLSWMELYIRGGGQDILEISWKPTSEIGCRHSFTICDGKRTNRNIPVSFKTATQKKTNVKSKTKPAVKLPLVRKQISPSKKLLKPKPSPLKAFGTSRASPRQSRSRQVTTSPRHFPWTKESNKENFLSPQQPYFLSSTAASFVSPSKVNLSMDNREVFGRRDTYLLSPNCHERRETYILRVDKTETLFENAENLKATFTITPDSSPVFRDSLESPSRILVLRERNARETASSFETNLKTLDRFVFSPLEQRPEVLSPIYAGKSPNTSFETYVKGNNSSDFSGGTYVKDASVGDLRTLDESPLTSKAPQRSPVFVKPRTMDIECEPKKSHCLSAIAEESYVLNDTALLSGTKRKSPLSAALGIARNKRSRTEDWSKKGAAAFRVSKSSTGLNLQQFHNGQHLSTLSETHVRSVIVKNPFLYANIIDPFQTASMYTNQEWMDQQEERFRRWLNILLTPPAELDSKTEVDAAKVWLECKKKDVANAPTKETVSFNYNINAKLASLRKQAQTLFRSKETSDVLQKVCLVVESGKLSIREDRDLHLNLKLKSDIMALILGYNPLWLRIGLETVYNEVIPLKSNSDVHGLAHFIMTRFFKDPYLLKKHKTVYSPKYLSELKKTMLKKFLILVYFLDRAKNTRLIQHDPCLFCKNASEKESKLVLTHFARETLSAIGDITKYLKCLGYVVSHKQTYIHEFDYAVKNLGVDLRDGVRLAKTLEILQMRCDLTEKLRVPAISRLQKVHNVQLVFNALEQSGYAIQYDITPKDIVDGHKENTLSFLWQIIYKFEAPLMVKSASTIQRWFRSLPVLLKRKKLERHRHKRERAALAIQLWYKRKKLSQTYANLAIFVADFVRQRKQHLAALKIQSFYRMVTCKRRYLAQYAIIKKIQAYSKGYLIRNRYHQRIIAATLIQTTFRTYHARKTFIQLKNAAVLIQRRVRANKLARQQNQHFKLLKSSSLMIQRRYRAHAGMKTQRILFLTIRRSVITIQSVYRMYTVRKRYVRVINATRCIQRWYRAHKLRITQQNYYRSLKKSSIFIQRTFRANKAMVPLKNKYDALKRATVTIQRWYRARQCHRKYAALKIAVKFTQDTFRANRAMRACRHYYKQLRTSVIIIQRRYRAILHARLVYRVRNNAALAIQRWYKARSARIYYDSLRKAVVYTQRRYRRNKLCRTDRASFICVINSVVVIQQHFRASIEMKIVRKQFVVLKQATITIQRQFRALLLMRHDQKQYRDLKRATVITQRRFRTRQQLRSYRKLREVVVNVQRRFRTNKIAKQDRDSYLALKQSVLFVQRRFRGNKLMVRQRYDYCSLRESAITLQRRCRAWLVMKEQKTRYASLRKVTIAMQGRFRTKQLRNRFVTLKKCVTLIQRLYRANRLMLAQKNEYQRVRWGAITIQRTYRAFRAMRQRKMYYDRLRASTIIIQRRFRANKLARQQRLYYLTLKERVIFIQRLYRANTSMRTQQNHYRTLKRAAITLQVQFRARKAMTVQKTRYETIRKSSLTIQRKFRANQLATKQRSHYLALKKSVIFMQRLYRANKSTKTAKNTYLRLKWAAVTVQRQYRAQHAMMVQKTYYENLRRVAITIQRRYRANKVTRQQRNAYLTLRKAVIFVQRSYRANKLMCQRKNEYCRLKWAAITLQRRFRARRAMKRAKQYYETLRKSTVMVQRKYRANKLMRHEREYYRKLKSVVTFMQRLYRANKSMLVCKNGYCKLRWAALVLQRRYRAQISMRAEMSKYKELKHATFVIQRMWKANLLTISMRQQYLSFRASVITIQVHFRAYLAMRRQRLMFLAKYKAITLVQKYSKGYLVRKRYLPMLQPEAVAARKVLKMQNAAAVKIQSAWKGYSVRKSNIPVMTALRKLRLKASVAPRNPDKGKTLSQKSDTALLCLTNVNSTLLMIIKALEDLDFVTRHCSSTCIRMSQLLPNQLYLLITSTARSRPEMIACNISTFILINFYKYRETRQSSWDPEYLDAVVNIMLNWCDKEAPLFSTLCTLLWLFAHEEKWNKKIRDVPNVRHRFVKIQNLVQRKQNMVSKTKRLANVASAFGPVEHGKLPTRDANWGLDYNRPNTFTNAVFAFNCVLEILDFLE